MAITERGASEMKRLVFGRYALSSSMALAMLAGCGGSQPPIGAPGAMPQTAGAGQARKATSSNDLLYAVSIPYVYVLSYPQGTLLESFSPPAQASFVGVCSGQSGNVFVTASYGGPSSVILEYTHGGTTPVETLDFDGEPDTCSVDPTTGNLAVTNNTTSYGNVGIYKGAQGNASYYTANLVGYSACAYDDGGNLFVDGFTSSGSHTYLALTELSAGSGTFQTISLGKVRLEGERPGRIAWEGSYLAMGVSKPPHPQEIWHVQVSGSGGRIVGKTKAKDIYHWSIQGDTLLSPYGSQHTDIALFNYPKGRKPTEIINDGMAGLSALTVSIAPTK
jgi:hypothetical protein